MAGVWRCMLPVVVLMCVCLWGSTEAVGGARSRPRPQRRPPKKPKVEPIDLTPPAQNIDIQQMTGTWYLLNTASKCSYLINHGTKVEPTVINLTHSSDTLSVSTKTRRNHQCWEILQVYHVTPTPGKLKLKGGRPELDTEIVIRETDYNSYAIMYYQKQGKITMKLYGRSVDNLSEPMLTKFEQLAEKQGFGLAYLFPFPTYSHCGVVDQNHVIKAQSKGEAMRNTLLRMLGALMCAVAACAAVTPVQDFDLQKMAGKWYIVGFATNAQWFVNNKAGMKTGTAMIVPTGEDLDLSYANLNADGTCWRMTHLAKKTDTPGRFTFHSQIWNNDNDMQIVDVVYDDYALVHTIKTKDGVSEVLNKLYSRSPEASAVLQQKFTQLSLETGILADNIAILPQNAECPAV